MPTTYNELSQEAILLNNDYTFNVIFNLYLTSFLIVSKLKMLNTSILEQTNNEYCL